MLSFQKVAVLHYDWIKRAPESFDERTGYRGLTELLELLVPDMYYLKKVDGFQIPRATSMVALRKRVRVQMEGLRK
jgi:hypothetical protein